jgi:hypothetical protein
MSTIHASTFITTPRERNVRRLDNCAFAVVLAAMFSLQMAVLWGVFGITTAESAATVAGSSEHSTPTRLVLADRCVVHQ